MTATTIRPTAAATTSTARRSVGAVAAALVATALAAAAADQILQWLGVFPPWGEITYEPAPYALAVTYRALFGVGGGWLAARWAPRAPRRHALWLGVVGTAIGLVGVAAALTRDLGPVWYPVLLLLLALPTAWLGGTLHTRGAAR
jgi:hypothetical protein